MEVRLPLCIGTKINEGELFNININFYKDQSVETLYLSVIFVAQL